MSAVSSPGVESSVEIEGLGPMTAAFRARAWIVLVHGLALGLVVALLRLETSRVLTSGGLVERLTHVLAGIAAVLIFESALLVFAHLPRSGSRRRWIWLVAAVHAAAYTVTLVDHQYFLEMGSRLSLEQVLVAFRQLDTLGGLLATGIDRRLPWRLAEVAGCFAFAAFVATRRPILPRIASRPLLLQGGVPAIGVAFYLSGAAAAAIGSDSAMLADQGANLQLGSILEAEKASDGPYYIAPRIAGRAAERRPNVVLLVLESTRASVVGTYQDGNEPSDTPELDELARRGIVFEDAYTSVTHTSKAMVGLVCGAYPRLESEVKESTPRGNPLACLPRLLESLGYRTRFMQSARGDFENFPGLVRNMGFDSWIMREQLGGRGFQKVGYFGMDEFSLVDPALEWIAGEEPFFLTVLTSVAHHPYTTPGVKPLEGKENALANYRRAVRHVDEFVGAFVRELEAKAHGETVFIITADHGQAFGEHQARAHDRVPYQEGTHVPLVVYGPDWLGPPRRVGGLRQHFDVLPTVLEVLGARWKGRVPGKSLLDERGHDVVVTSCQETRMCMGMRAGDWKFVYRFGQARTEVYDLAHDPLEKRNLAASFPRAWMRSVDERLAGLESSVMAFYADADAERERPVRTATAPRLFPGRGDIAPARLDEPRKPLLWRPAARPKQAP